ncbi:hypothetical protein [Trichormus azollae]|jgi:hypothetical protein|uniref:Uncharacterized protein n=1 Tax=Nostoc azollae (strain 0708) TaxID=551115 RepID=D7E4X2_NOSA0|nr:hypothetical protein [Trichormus azollae]ADI65438.1 conserved hypothetical protein ['Nostoc azollae' 0708]
MTKNIYSSLDLSEWLKDFQEPVTKLLESNNIPQWNGQTSKAHEENIRPLAELILCSNRRLSLF